MASVAVLPPPVSNGTVTSISTAKAKKEEEVAEEDLDLYKEVKGLEKQLEFVELQEEYFNQAF